MMYSRHIACYGPRRDEVARFLNDMICQFAPRRHIAPRRASPRLLTEDESESTKQCQASVAIPARAAKVELALTTFLGATIHQAHDHRDAAGQLARDEPA